MLSKTKVKYIRSLELKKFRNENNVFVAEGNKLVADMLPAFECELLIAKPSWMATQGDIPAKELLVAEEDDIRKASFLKNPQDVLAIFKRPNWDITEITPEKELVLALDGIQDPGNLGTIIRLADWFGISISYAAKIPPSFQSKNRTSHYGCARPRKNTLHRSGNVLTGPICPSHTFIRHLPWRRKLI